MIGVWLLVGSLAGGVEGSRLEADFASTSADAVLAISVRAEASALALWDTDPPRATIHLRRAMRGFDRLWLLGYRNSAVASRMGECHFRFKEYPEAIAWARRGLRFAPGDETCLSLLDRGRATVRYPIEGEGAKLLMPPDGGKSFRLNPIYAFALFAVGCLKSARGWMKRDRVLLALGIGELLLGVGLEAWIRVEAARQEREWSTPTVVIRGPETTLRGGNGTLYPPRVNPPLPAGLEAKLLLKRGDWLQVELATGVVGWVKEQQAIVIEIGSRG